ncbi:MAG TPA: aminoacyl-tRNA hydrolase [Acidimicrobiales bacterium]|nr:aminoacyl-tRNA hydrolase [Acidimicrobiales bacterium]
MALRRARENDRRGQASTLLIVGLANPGSEYEGSRHNVGGDALRLAAQRRGAKLTLERRQRALSVTITTPRGPVTLAVPTTFMNESGAALPPLLRRTSIDDLTKLVVVHDELDLEPGRLQLKFGGGLAGHNGLRSIAQTLSTQDFARLRVGIGKPPSKEQGADYVLRRPTGKSRDAAQADVARAADAIETLLDYDFDEAQRRVNGS